jgi:hypothetical protein
MGTTQLKIVIGGKMKQRWMAATFVRSMIRASRTQLSKERQVIPTKRIIQYDFVLQ